MTADTEPIILKTQHGYEVSFIPDFGPNHDVQFHFNGKFRFAIPMSDLREIMEYFQQEAKCQNA